MLELIRNAWMGWGEYIRHGKLAAVFFAVLLFVWFGKRYEKQKAFLVYATVFGAFCVCPLTAACLMGYQTRFYDYQWIWSAVPVTGVIAFGAVNFLAELWGMERIGECAAKDVKKGRKSHGERLCSLLVTVLLLTVLLLSGSLGSDMVKFAEEDTARSKTYVVVEQLRTYLGEEEICLWAPKEILEYVREADAGITLLYGRNMWDLALNGYAYDVYSEDVLRLFHFMESLKEADVDPEWYKEFLKRANVENRHAIAQSSDRFGELVGEMVETARMKGVNCVLLPGEAPEEMVQELAKGIGATVKKLEEYWVIYE